MSIKKNAAWNMLGMGAPLLVAAVAIPYIVKHAGVEAFGVLTMVWALIGYFSLFDFGLGRALTQKIAVEISLGEYENIPDIAKSGLIFTAIAGAIGALILIFLSHSLAYQWLKISAGLQHEAFLALIVSGFGIPLTTLATGQRGILEAYEDFKNVNIARMLLGTANFGLPAASVYFFSSSLVWMVVSLVCARLANVLAFSSLVNARLKRGWWIRGAWSTEKFKNLLSFGAWITVSNVISPLMVTADRFIISGIVGAAMVAYYSVPAEMMQRVLIVPAAIATALFPRFTALHKVAPNEGEKIYKKSMLFLCAVMSAVCLVIVVLSREGLSLWLGKAFSDRAWVVVDILAIGIFFNGMAQLPFARVQAAGRVDVTAKFHVLELCLYVPVLVLLAEKYGLNGAAVAWSLRAAMDFLMLAYMSFLLGRLDDD